MALAPEEIVIRPDAGGRPPARVCYENLQAYARNLISSAMAYPREHLIRREFRLARLDMTILFSSEMLADLCERRLVRRKHDDPPATKIEVYAIDARSNGWEAPALWREDAGFSSRDFDRLLDAGNLRGFYYHDAPSWQFYDRAAAAGVLSLPGPLDIPPWESGSPFRLFLHWAYAAANMRLAHAATLGLGGYGALITGASGSGKSGTTLAGLLNGLDSVGDDYVLVEQGARVVAHSVFTIFKQDPEGLRRARLPSSEVEASELNWHGKVEFDAARLSPNGLADRMEIGVLFIPEIARLRRTAIERNTAGRAALSLAPSGVFQLPGDTREGFRFLTNLVRRLPAFRVRLSEDPAEIADTIGSFLARARRNVG